MTGLSLYHMTKDYIDALSVLRDSEFDDETISDTLEGLTGELSIKASNVAAFALNIEAEAEAVKAAEDKLKKRRMMLEKRATYLRQYLLNNMQAAGITEIAAIDKSFRARVMAGRDSVMIDDETKLPLDYISEKLIREPDKVLIGKAIKDGHDVPGARLERKPSLKID